MRSGRHFARVCKKRSAYKILLGKPEGKSHCWKDNTNMYSRGIASEDWIHFVQDGNQWRIILKYGRLYNVRFIYGPVDLC